MADRYFQEWLNSWCNYRFAGGPAPSGEEVEDLYDPLQDGFTEVYFGTNDPGPENVADFLQVYGGMGLNNMAKWRLYQLPSEALFIPGRGVHSYVTWPRMMAGDGTNLLVAGF